MEEDDQDMIKQAKEEFEKYVEKEHGKMTYEDFEKFVKNFFQDKPEELKSMDIKNIFDEFSKEEKGKIDEREFRIAYEELKISRMDTNDRLKFDNL